MIRLPAFHQPQLFLPQEDSPQSLELNWKLTEQESVSLLKKCKAMEDLKQVHGQILKLGLIYKSFCVSNLLSTCVLSSWGSIKYASLILDQLDDPGSFDFNTMIRGHVKDNNFEDALYLFVEMLERRILPDNFTYPFVLKACSAMYFIELGTQIHGQVLKLGFYDDIFVQNSLINTYGKCGNLRDSGVVFEQMEQKSVASWSALISAHAKLGLWWECLKLFGDMMGEGCCRAEEGILVSLLSACTHLGALDLGRSIHGYLLRNSSGLNVIVETSLLNMYIKCGSIEKGFGLFDRMRSTKNRLSYSVMITGLSMHGHGDKALKLFSEMLKQGIDPDDVIYVGVLSACRHTGLVEKGLEFFDKMRVDHEIQPTSQHYGCIVDLLGQAGMFNEALDLIEKMPMAPNDVIWRSLLTAARVHRNLEVGEKAVQNLIKLDTNNAGDYVMISNLYARAQKWTDGAMARTMIADRRLDQVPGVSLVEVKRKMYSFVSQDKSHPGWEEIYEMINQMEWQLKFEGYFPDISEDVHNVDAEEKRQRLRYHSLKLALAFALIYTSENTPIRIVRNVRMCRDCHTYTKFISLVYNRKIIVRDRNQFHHFKDGTCSCWDYW